MNEGCPKCGSPLCERRNKRTGTQFMGCSSWPDCKYTRSITNFDDAAWGQYVQREAFEASVAMLANTNKGLIK